MFYFFGIMFEILLFSNLFFRQNIREKLGNILNFIPWTYNMHNGKLYITKTIIDIYY